MDQRFLGLPPENWRTLITPMKFIMEPENCFLEKDIPFGNYHFQLLCLISGGCNKVKVFFQVSTQTPDISAQTNCLPTNLLSSQETSSKASFKTEVLNQMSARYPLDSHSQELNVWCIYQQFPLTSEMSVNKPNAEESGISHVLTTC